MIFEGKPPNFSSFQHTCKDLIADSLNGKMKKKMKKRMKKRIPIAISSISFLSFNFFFFFKRGNFLPYIPSIDISNINLFKIGKKSILEAHDKRTRPRKSETTIGKKNEITNN